MFRWIPVLLICAVVGVAGCSRSKEVESLPIPTPATSPMEASPVGNVWSVGPKAEGIATGNGRIAVTVANPSRVLLLDATGGALLHTVTLQAQARKILFSEDAFYVPAGKQLVKVPSDGTLETRYNLDDPLTKTTLRAAAHAGAIMGTTTAIVDSSTSALALYTNTGRQIQKLRAGDGAVGVVALTRDRFAVLDARGRELLVYSTTPLFLRQRYPLDGGPFGFTYDAKRNIAWITLTEKNELIGLRLDDGTPREVARYATVRQPNSVAVEANTGTVYVTGAFAGCVQQITPEETL